MAPGIWSTVETRDFPGAFSRINCREGGRHESFRKRKVETGWGGTHSVSRSLSRQPELLEGTAPKCDTEQNQKGLSPSLVMDITEFLWWNSLFSFSFSLFSVFLYPSLPPSCSLSFLSFQVLHGSSTEQTGQGCSQI